MCGKNEKKICETEIDEIKLFQQKKAKKMTKIRNLSFVVAQLFLLIYCANLVTPDHVSSSEQDDHASSDSDLDSDYADSEDYHVDDFVTPTSTNHDARRKVSGCDEGMFQCADK